MPVLNWLWFMYCKKIQRNRKKVAKSSSYRHGDFKIKQTKTEVLASVATCTVYDFGQDIWLHEGSYFSFGKWGYRQHITSWSAVRINWHIVLKVLSTMPVCYQFSLFFINYALSPQKAYLGQNPGLLLLRSLMFLLYFSVCYTATHSIL